MEISYFEICEEDIPVISAMEEKYFSQPWKEESILHYMESGNMIFIVAKETETGKTAAYSAVLCIADEGDLVSIAVDEDHRSMGIARELLDITYEMAAERGVAKIHLEVRESNEPAINLYESEGFIQDGRRKKFYRSPEEDALLYTKELLC